MKKNLNQELKDAFEALDAERVKALLAAGADKSRRVRNELLGATCGYQVVDKPEKPEPTGDEERDAHMQKRYATLVQRYQKNLKERQRNLRYMKLLLENGANPNWIDSDSCDFGVPLLDSLSAFNFDEAQLLIDNGAHVDIRYDGYTPLTWFATELDCYANLDTIKFLHKNGANLNAKNRFDGRTALMNMTGFNEFSSYAAFEDLTWLIEPIKFVASHGAKVNLQDNSGKTALVYSLAQKWGHSMYDLDWKKALQYKDNFSTAFYYEIPKILLSNGAHIGIEDKSGKDAMAYAVADEEKMDLFARAIDDSNKFVRQKIVVMSR